MNETDLRKLIVDKLTSVAPDLEGEAIEPDVNFRDQFDFDSMDLLNFAIALHEALDIEIPEVDYPRLASLDSCTAYLGERLGGERHSG